MEYIKRKIEKNISLALRRNKSVLLFGARQTGKTTLLLNQIKSDLYISLANPVIRQRYEKDLALLAGEIEALGDSSLPLIIIDEVQKIPEIMDLAQDFIDRKKARFILTGSSARKLKKHNSINFLPGRVVALKLMPLMSSELPLNKKQNMLELLLYGSLPGIIIDTDNANKETDLSSYVTTYLEEEIRAEALVRNVGVFARFLELAASESGNIINFRKLSQQIGIAHTTIAAYYQILEDCLIAERIDPLSNSKTRRRIIQMPKYLFFDLGVRRVSANEGTKLPNKYIGLLFEQFIGLEILRLISLSDDTHAKLYFWRDVYGNEIDWVIEVKEKYIPIEVKLTQNPSIQDARHLETFLQEYANTEKAYIICTAPRKIKIADNIYAIPWQDLESEVL